MRVPSVNEPSRLPPAVDAELRTVDRRAGRIGYYVAGNGPPLLLLHSINAAGSVAEVAPVFDRYRDSHRVYAPDLPGFGQSDRSDRNYTPRLYTDAVHDLLDVIAEDAGDGSFDALALSLGAEFLARAAAEAPERFRSVALVTPTGFSRGSDKLREPEGSTREMPLLSAILEFPLWRRALYRGLVRPGSIRYFLKRTWGSDRIDETMAAYADRTTHRPGAENAPYAFLSGRLFSKDIRRVYEKLEMPVWLAHGTRGDFRDFSCADWTADRDNWSVTAYDTGALPFFEVPDSFFRDYLEFLQQAHGPDSD